MVGVPPGRLVIEGRIDVRSGPGYYRCDGCGLHVSPDLARRLGPALQRYQP